MTLEIFQRQCVLIFEVHFETPKIFNHFNIVHTTNDKVHNCPSPYFVTCH